MIISIFFKNNYLPKISALPEIPTKSNKNLNNALDPVLSLSKAEKPPSLFYLEKSHYTDKFIGHLKDDPNFLKKTTNKLVSSLIFFIFLILV